MPGQTLHKSFSLYHHGLTTICSQRTRLKTTSTDKHYSLDSEDDLAQVVETSVTNNSSFQNYTHPDDHTIQTTDTPGFKPIYYNVQNVNRIDSKGTTKES